MGWWFKFGSTRKGTIQEETQGWEKDGHGVKTIAKQFKGNAFSGVLYVVRQPYVVGQQENIENRYIDVVLLRYKKDNGWGSKSMDESMHPYYYSCPLKYLAMVPKVGCQEWRDIVHNYWERQRQKRRDKLIQKKILCGIN